MRLTPAANTFDRRKVLKSLACAAALGIDSSVKGAERRTGMGLVTYCSRFRRTHLQETEGIDLFQPLQFLRHCQAMGVGGMQVGLGVTGHRESRGLKEQVESAEMYLEAIIRAPFKPAEVERFEAEVKTAKAAGALAIRTTVIPGRRYEYFDTLHKFKEYEARAFRAVELAAPVVERHRLPLAIENHKDQRLDERLKLFERFSSEFVGACLDTGNSVALLEEPLDTARALAPWTHSVHLKDQSLKRYPEGFLLADIPLGQGSLDLKSVVTHVRAKRPHVRFSLELITRDALRVPCLKPAYWATMPDVPARVLAEMLAFVQQHSRDNLQSISSMLPAARLATEDRNVRESIVYAGDVLKL